MSEDTYIIAISGASCSGKTTLAEALCGELDDAAVFGFDAYYRDFSGVSHQDINVDVPEALDHDLAASHLRELRAGRSVAMPIYDYATHARMPETRRMKSARYLVVEGLFSLHWEEIRVMVDLAVFIDADPDACRARRIERDTRDRGRDAESIIYQLDHKVIPMYEQHVAPTRTYAGLVLDGTQSMKELVAQVLARLR